MSDSKNLKQSTRLVHVGRNVKEQFGFVNTPIYRGSTVLYPDTATLKSRNQRFTYGTHGTPTTESLEEAWNDLAKAADTVLVPSGLAAIVIALTACLKSGDHLLMTDSVYRPTRNYCEGILKRFGVETQYYDPLIGAGIEKLIRPNTAAIFTESPGSQSFEMQDIPAISRVAKKHNLCLLMDNTWATPLYFSPHEMGVDLAIEAGTKYLSGHSDLLLGVVSANEKWAKPLREAHDLTAMCAGPEDVFLALRGLRTMKLRLEEAERQAMKVALWLQNRPEVSRILHPALMKGEQHEIWKRDFKGASGLFSIVLKPRSEAQVAAFLDSLKLFGMGFSWGGFESLIIPFNCAEYRTVTSWQPEGPCLRLQIGFEDVEDLIEDLSQGFEQMAKA